MKKFLYTCILSLIAIVLCISNVSAATSLPDNFVTDTYKTVEYISGFPVIYKTANNGKYPVYCINLEKTYDANLTYNKAGKANDGYIYILNNRPKTSNPERDFYITQMAVWYLSDLINNNNVNLEPDVKYYIINHKNDDDIASEIYKLFEGAANYIKPAAGTINFNQENVTFTKDNEYFISSEIIVTTKNINSIKYSLTNAPKGTELRMNDNGNLYLKVPVSSIPYGKQVVMSLDVTGNYNNESAYHYSAGDAYQNLLFDDVLVEKISSKNSKEMIINNVIEKYPVVISKTDITGTDEVPGATLEIRDINNNIIEKWISSTNAYTVNLETGKYTLTETIAPIEYKRNKNSITFEVTTDGKVLVNNEVVNKVVMVNELKDTVIIKKLDSDTKELLSGAHLVIKNNNGEVVKDFITDGDIYSLLLNEGEYTLSEIDAPTGYIKNENVISFKINEDGILLIKNENGEYTESESVSFYNTKDDIVVVPDTASSNTLLIISGIALLVGGVFCVKHTIKEC